ncbi:bifunctional DNA primase/polymerase [Methylobacterium sp. Gmos1]
MNSVNKNTDLAAIYAECGVRVFPCRERDTTRGKAKAPYTRNGHHSSSAASHTMSLWAATYPDAIYGIPCSANGLFVLDADRHGGCDGVQSLMTLFAHYKFDWSNVPIVNTPRDGLHVLFARPGELGRTKSVIAPAIDVRDLGYVIAPGTILPDGREYRLTNGTIAQLGRAIAEHSLLPVPSWLVHLASPPTQAVRPKPTVNNHQVNGRQLRGIISVIRDAPIGERNRSLHWAACRCGELVVAGGISDVDAYNLLYQSARAAGLNDCEIRNTIASGMRKGMAGRRHEN